MEWSNRQKVAATATGQQVPFNIYFEEQDVNTPDLGIQGFIYKKILDAGVNVAVGSPVGAVQASGAQVVTPDFSDTNALAIKGKLGGLAPVAVLAGVTAYGWIQCFGLNRMAAKCTGAVAAGVGVEWSNDDTFIALSTAQNIFGYSLVAAASGSIAIGGLYLLG